MMLGIMPRVVRTSKSATVLGALLACAGLAASLAAQLSGPLPRPAPQAGVIRVNAPSVVVDVIVTDKKGRPVSGLTASDFAVYENNVPQKIVTFVPPLAVAPGPGRSKPKGEQKASRVPPAQAASSATAQNFRETGANRRFENFHFITLVMDLGDMQPADRTEACNAAAKYLRRDVAPEDYISIYAIAQNQLDPLLALSRDRRAAEQAIQALARRAPSGIMTKNEREAIEKEMAELKEGASSGSPAAMGYHLQRLALRSMLWGESAMQARSVFVALRAVAQSLAVLPGRKNVVLFSSGFINSRQDAAPVAAVIDAASRANVAFYVIDASGLTEGSEAFSAESRVETAVPNTSAAEMNEMAQAGPEENFGTDKFDWMEHLMLSDPDADLEAIARGTGGLMIRHQNDLLAALERVDSDLREYYTLVYQPSSANYDGTFRRIRVELKKRGYALRYRKGYWAVPPGEAMMVTPATAQLVAAADAGTLQAAFRLPTNAAELIAGNGKWAVPVSVLVSGKDVNLDKSANLYRGSLTMVVTVRDLRGSLLGIYQRLFEFRLDENKYREFRKDDFDLTAQVAIPRPEPVIAQTILQLSDGRVALGARRLDLPSATASGDMQITSLVLTNDIKPLSRKAAGSSNALRSSGYELGLLPEPRFSHNDLLFVYFGVANVPVSPTTGEPDLRLSFAIKSSA